VLHSLVKKTGVKKDMITLYLVRHGETDYNQEDRVQGQKDSNLTDFGRKQAQALAEAFKDVKIDQVYTSPLKRAADTAKVIVDGNHLLEVNPIDEFMELDCGIFEDKLISEIKEENWDKWTEFLASPNVAPEGGESMNQLFVRVSKALEMILANAGEDENIVIVSHAGVVRMSLAHLMNIQVASAVNFGLSNASVARFINKYDRWTCLKWNDTEHLGMLEGEVKFVL
jgi:probable phosphoglycerate mutase